MFDVETTLNATFLFFKIDVNLHRTMVRTKDFGMNSGVG